MVRNLKKLKKDCVIKAADMDMELLCDITYCLILQYYY